MNTLQVRPAACALVAMELELLSVGSARQMGLRWLSEPQRGMFWAGRTVETCVVHVRQESPSRRTPRASGCVQSLCLSINSSTPASLEKVTPAHPPQKETPTITSSLP